MSDSIEKIASEMVACANYREETGNEITTDGLYDWATRLRSLRQVPEVGNRYGFSGGGVDLWANDSTSIDAVREWRHKAGIADALRARVADLESNPAPPTSDKPSECADGCPPFQVCDHCQQPSDAVWLMPVATQEPGDSRLLRFAWGRSNLSTGQIAHAYDCIVGAAKECGQTLAAQTTPAQADSLRQVPDAKPLADRLQRESECTAEAAHHFYAQGWNACRDAIANPAPPTSGDPLNALADDEAERLQYERDKRDPANCLTDATPEQAGAAALVEAFEDAVIRRMRAYNPDDPMPKDGGSIREELVARNALLAALGAQAGAELPEPAGVLVINGQALRGFTADQMREMYRRGLKDARLGGQ